MFCIGKKDFWDTAYREKSEMSCEWYFNYEHIKSIINKYCDRTNKILHVGCGSSELGEKMYKDNYRF
jgi:hypothetical protein